MRDWKGNEHTWPTRLSSERRLHPRVGVGFPIGLKDVASGQDVPGVVTDVSLGGLRVLVPNNLETGSSLNADFVLVVTNREGEQVEHKLTAPVDVIRSAASASPVSGGATQADVVAEYELSLQFTSDDNERERLLGVFMLQTLLFVADAQLR